MMMTYLISLVLLFHHDIVLGALRRPFDFSLKASISPSRVLPTNQVFCFKTQESLSNGLCADFIDCAKREIESKNAFYCAVPGGSVLKMLGGLKSVANEIDWTKVFLYYVNHKCVSNTDPSATHFKAKSLFIDAVGIPSTNVFTLSEDGESKGHNTEAHLYEKLVLQHVPQYFGVPRFDYMLLGMGKDGHIGSLYPDRKEVEVTTGIVLAVDKKQPASITLSLPTMNAAKQIRIVLDGAGKAEAMYTGLFKTKSWLQFPVCGVNNAVWMVDEGACSLVAQANYEHIIVK